MHRYYKQFHNFSRNNGWMDRWIVLQRKGWEGSWINCKINKSRFIGILSACAKVRSWRIGKRLSTTKSESWRKATSKIYKNLLNNAIKIRSTTQNIIKSTQISYKNTWITPIKHQINPSKANKTSSKISTS